MDSSEEDNSGTSEEFSFEIKSRDELYNQMQETLKSVEQLLEIPKDVARLMLSILQWDKDKLFEQFFENNLNHLCELFNIAIRTSGSKPSAVGANCDICIESHPNTEMILLHCGHYFCQTCCDIYVKIKIQLNSVGIGITCPGTNCNYLISDSKICEMLKDTFLWNAYEDKLLTNFITSNKFLRPCPADNCNYVLKVDYIAVQPLKCGCGTIFCCKCGQDWHESVTCEQLKIWIKLCNEDSNTSSWLAENTKECPNCAIVIMKDGGCNHVICRNVNCNKHFCWVCLGPWEQHGSSWYNCNRYDEEDGKLARNKLSEYRRALNRFLFYSNRYKTHKLSLELEKTLFEIIDDQLLSRQINWNEVEYLQEAIKTLIECRQSLMYTFAFAYYLEKNNQVVIFEENQKDLETATELLSEYLERDIKSTNFFDAKQMVQDKYRYCSKRRLILIDHVREGYEKNLWQFKYHDLDPMQLHI